MYLEGVNYYTNRLLFSNCWRTAVIKAFNTLTDKEIGTSCGWSR